MRLEKLAEACKNWVQERLLPELNKRIRASLGDHGWRLEVDPEMQDGQCILFHYPTVFSKEAAGYVRPVVKIELGARSDDWPAESREFSRISLDQLGRAHFLENHKARARQR